MRPYLPAAVLAPLLLLFLCPLLIALLVWMIRTAHPLFAAVQNGLDRVNTVLQENLAGVRVVKAGHVHIGQILAFINDLLHMLTSLMMVGMLLTRIAQAESSSTVPTTSSSPRAAPLWMLIQTCPLFLLTSG